jgi:uncharacterized protein YraI
MLRTALALGLVLLGSNAARAASSASTSLMTTLAPPSTSLPATA